MEVQLQAMEGNVLFGALGLHTQRHAFALYGEQGTQRNTVIGLAAKMGT